MNRSIIGICLALGCAAWNALAFIPPQDTKDGVTLRIEGFDETRNTAQLEVREVPCGEPLPFTVVLRNTRKEPVKGTVTVWLNDDWEIVGKNTAELSAPAEGNTTASFSAKAKDRVLSALYPIHAKLELPVGGKPVELHPIAVFRAVKPVKAAAASDEVIPCEERTLRLDDRSLPHHVYAKQGTNQYDFGTGFWGVHEKTGTSTYPESMNGRGVQRNGIFVHPPWREGWGETWCDYTIRLSGKAPATLVFHNALPATSASSDGVDFRVFAAKRGEQPKQLFQRFSASKEWEKAKVDLSAFKGETITLRLWTGPGPKNDTNCDSSFWGDPMIVLGAPLTEPTEDEWFYRENQARQYAQDKLYVLRTGIWLDYRQYISFLIRSPGEDFGAGVELGKQGLIDGAIAFSDTKDSVAYRGFTVFVDGQRVGAGDDGLPVERVSSRLDSATWEITHFVRMKGGALIPLRARLWVEGAALRVAWDMPDVQRDKRGSPRYTKLAIGPGSFSVWRVYAGFGWVFEDPVELAIPSGGLGLTARHVAADYDNGLSLLQAVSVFPDRLAYSQGSKTFALETHGDNIFTLLPTGKGAFAAARKFVAISGYAPSKGVARLAGKQCLDQWDGGYDRTADDLALTARYGVRDAVFVKHVWQRWGYDYRLPEIFPPSGGMDGFKRMREAAKKAGILFVPHDNYIDFYPDADGFSYDKTVFNGDGTPQLAWYNPGPRAQSYRWLPHGFTPSLRENMKKMHDAFQPDGIFIDVFSSRPPEDYYDRGGTYYPKTRTAEEWGGAFDTCREFLGSTGAMISEGGTDALIGHLDAGEADHVAPSRIARGYKNAERIPWHDIVTHGRMILFAGGLGSRYSDAEPSDTKGDNNKLYGYGSDDYLSNTVIGGRNPMSDGPFSRRAVMTYWLLHDVCAALSRETFEAHEFVKTIQQQHAVFSHGCEVWTNRGSNDWTVAGYTLPQYGFYAKTAKARAGVVLLRGQRAGFAESDGVYFADARPEHGEQGDAESHVAGAKYLGNGAFEVTFHWNFLRGNLTEYVPFIHIENASAKASEKTILFQSTVPVPPEKLVSGGDCDTVAKVEIPQNLPTGDYEILYGMFAAKTDGNRLAIRGNEVAHQRRIRGGVMRVTKKDGKFDSGTFLPAAEDAAAKAREKEIAVQLGLNTRRKMVDFGTVATDGAFRLICPKGDALAKTKEWQLIPLPDGHPFRAELNLAKLGVQGRRVTAVKAEPLLADDTPPANPEWKQEGDKLSLSCDQVFAYHLLFE